MPRSVDALDRPGEKPSVSYSANTATTPNAPTTGRYVNSVSDLYGADEIEVLLDEIKDLEPCSFHTEDFQVTRRTEAPPEFRAISSRHRVMTLVRDQNVCKIVWNYVIQYYFLGYWRHFFFLCSLCLTFIYLVKFVSLSCSVSILYCRKMHYHF
jgi:hypothetical protein